MGLGHPRALAGGAVVVEVGNLEIWRSGARRVDRWTVEEVLALAVEITTLEHWDTCRVSSDENPMDEENSKGRKGSLTGWLEASVLPYV